MGDKELTISRLNPFWELTISLMNCGGQGTSPIKIESSLWDVIIIHTERNCGGQGTNHIKIESILWDLTIILTERN